MWVWLLSNRFLGDENRNIFEAEILLDMTKKYSSVFLLKTFVSSENKSVISHVIMANYYLSTFKKFITPPITHGLTVFALSKSGSCEL